MQGSPSGGVIVLIRKIVLVSLPFSTKSSRQEREALLLEKVALSFDPCCHCFMIFIGEGEGAPQSVGLVLPVGPACTAPSQVLLSCQSFAVTLSATKHCNYPGRVLQYQKQEDCSHLTSRITGLLYSQHRMNTV